MISKGVDYHVTPVKKGQACQHLRTSMFFFSSEQVAIMVVIQLPPRLQTKERFH